MSNVCLSIRLLETIEAPVWLEDQILVASQLRSGRTFIRVPEAEHVSRSDIQNIKGSHIAKHLWRKSSANGDKLISDGTGGPCFV